MTMLHDFSEIGLSVVKNLNTRTLNISLSKLAENDQAILPPNDYIPKVWENKWYNDDTVGGYSKGDVVWKWSLTEQQFLDNYGPLVKAYASQNERLQYYLPDSWTSSADKAKYVNVISGYAENIGSSSKPQYRQFFPMLFDFCFDYSIGKYNPNRKVDGSNRIEIYISLVDDNKSLLSDSTAWKNLALRTNAEQRQYLSSELSSMIDKHIKYYHLDGAKTRNDFDSILLASNLSNFNISDAYSRLKVRDHQQYINQQGVDYVVKFGKSAISTKVVPLSTESGISLQDTMLYRWYRQWSSGYLEHGGTVEIPSKDVSATQDLSDYEYQIDLNWEVSPGVSAPIYDYPTYTSSYYGGAFDLLYFAKTSAETIQAPILTSIPHLGCTNRYTVSLTPVAITSGDISLVTQKFKPFSEISGLAYPELANDDKNATYLNFEIHEQRNASFKIVRSTTRDLRDNSIARYIQYYTAGYIAKADRDYSMQACTLKNFNKYYIYDAGNPISCDGLEVWTNDGDILTRDVDYIVYFDDAQPYVSTVGPHTIYIEGKEPYRGTISEEFWVSYEFSNTTISVAGLLEKYRYGEENS